MIVESLLHLKEFTIILFELRFKTCREKDITVNATKISSR